MNVHTIEICRDEALQKLAAYRALNARQRTHDDQRLEFLYKAVAKGARVVNIAEAIRATGLNDLGQPKLAIARADWSTVIFNPGWSGAGTFWDRSLWERGHAGRIRLPDDTFPRKQTAGNDEIRSAVPHIPPPIRPKISLSNFHILFEVEKWNTYPVDPYLLRRIQGDLYVVIAEWELTELEASLLGSMRAGN